MIPSRQLNIGDIIGETFMMSWKTLLRVVLVALILSIISTFISVYGITEVVETGNTVLQRDYPLDSSSVAVYRVGVLKEIKEENPLFFTLYLPDVKIDFDEVINSVADTLKVDSSTLISDSVPSIDTRGYLDEASSFFYDNSEALFGDFSSIFLVLLLAIILSIFLSTFILDICIRYFEERKLDIVSALRITLRRNLWMSVLVFLLVIFILLCGFGVMIGIAVIMPIALGIIFNIAACCMLVFTVVRLIFAQVALVSEELGPWESLHRSWALTKGYFLRTVGIFIVLFLMTIVLEGVIQTIIGVFDMSSTEIISGLIAGKHTNVSTAIDELITLIQISSIQGLITTVLFITFTPSLLTIMYYDLRTRKDGSLTYPEETVLPPTL